MSLTLISFPASKKCETIFAYVLLHVIAALEDESFLGLVVFLGENALHLLCLSIFILSLARIILEASELFTTQSARKGE